MFVDRIKVFAQAGDGGRGCVSFRREKFVPRGGPDGGDGGRGGDVILRADVHTDNLSNLFYEPIIKAKSGVHGQGKKKHGRAAQPKVVKVTRRDERMIGILPWGEARRAYAPIPLAGRRRFDSPATAHAGAPVPCRFGRCMAGDGRQPAAMIDA